MQAADYASLAKYNEDVKRWSANLQEQIQKVNFAKNKSFINFVANCLFRVNKTSYSLEFNM